MLQSKNDIRSPMIAGTMMNIEKISKFGVRNKRGASVCSNVP